MALGLLTSRVVRLATFLFCLYFVPLLCRASGEDQAVLDEINLARTQPGEYANIVEQRMQGLQGADPDCVAEATSFLRRQRPLDPLQRVPGLEMSARAQVADQGPTGSIGHRGADGSSPWTRMMRVGLRLGLAGENISYGYGDARTIVVTLIVDQGVPGRGHRKNIFSRAFKVAGAACGAHALYGTMCVIDFAEGFLEKGARTGMSGAWRGAGD